MNEATNPGTRADTLLLVAFCGFLFFYGLGAFGLLGADEPRYAQVAREMLERSDWVTPTLQGKPWLEKPVLYYWEAMVSFRAFGITDRAARLPAAFDAALLVAAVYFFLARFRPGSEFDGALITASSAGVIGFAHAAGTDMPLAAALSMALLAWYAWNESGRHSFLAAFYIFLALGTLAKGPVAPALSAVIIFLFVAVKRDWQAILRSLWVPGIILYMAVGMPWYVGVQLRNPEFFRVFILEHNFARFSTDTYHHHQPFWFYLPVFLLTMMPWTVALIMSVLESVRGMWCGAPAPKGAADLAELAASLKRCPDTKRGVDGMDTKRGVAEIDGIDTKLGVAEIGAMDTKRGLAEVGAIEVGATEVGATGAEGGMGVGASDPKRGMGGVGPSDTTRQKIERGAFFNSGDSWPLFLLIWMLVPILFFSASQSKLPGYILPAVPAGALLVAEYLAGCRAREKKIALLFAAAHGVLCGLLIFCAISAASLASAHHLRWGRESWKAAALAAFFAPAIAAALVSRSGLRLFSRCTAFAVVVSVGAVIRLAAPAIDATQSARPIAESLQAFSHEPVPLGLYHVGRVQEYGLEFYLNRPAEKYEDGSVPTAPHVLVAAQGTQLEVAQLVPGRRVSYLTSVPAQKVDLYWVK
jgi:4-amino-4-deoxy-L-arabinose transferase-like glycosyltransferase